LLGFASTFRLNATVPIGCSPAGMRQSTPARAGPRPRNVTGARRTGGERPAGLRLVSCTAAELAHSEPWWQAWTTMAPGADRPAGKRGAAMGLLANLRFGLQRARNRGKRPCGHLDQIHDVTPTSSGCQPLPEPGRHLGASADVHDRRAGAVLRLLQEQARQPPRPPACPDPPDRPLHGAR
jgi:hypothetical protein